MPPSAASPLEVPASSGPQDRPRRTHVPRIVGPPGGEDPSAESRPLVLVAEDHEDSRDALRTLLEAYGYEVAEAADGREAVQLARALRPALVLMDLMMPRMDGLEAIRALRSDPAFASVRIIAVTALESARDEVLAAGGDDLVLKPLDVRRLLARLPDWIGA